MRSSGLLALSNCALVGSCSTAFQCHPRKSAKVQFQLKTWVETFRDPEQRRRNFELKVADWNRHNRNGAWLDTPQLKDAQKWLADPLTTNVGFSTDFVELVAASHALSRKAAQQRFGVIGFVMLLLLIVVGITIGSQSQAKRNRQTIEENQRQLILQQQAAAATSTTFQATTVASGHARETAQAEARAANTTAQAETNARMTAQALALAEPARATAVAEEKARATAQALAETRGAQSIANLLTVQSEVTRQNMETWPVSVLLATEALKLAPSDKSEAAARAGLKLLLRPAAIISYGDTVTAIAWSNTPSYVASGSVDGTATVRDMQAARQLTRVSHGAPIWAIAISPDGSLLATVGDDRAVRLWRLPDGTDAGTISLGDMSATRALFSPNGQYLALAGSALTRVYSLANRKTVIDIAFGDTKGGLVGSANDIAFSPDSTWFAAASANTKAYIWSLSDGSIGHILDHTSDVTSLVFSPDSKQLATATVLGNLAIWDVAAGERITGMAANGFVWSIAFSPDGQQIATGGADATASIWDTHGGAEEKRISIEHAVDYVAFTPDGLSLLTGGGGVVQLWDIFSKKEIARVPSIQTTGTSYTGGQLHTAQLSVDGHYLATLAQSNSAVIWDLSSRTTLSARDAAVIAYSKNGTLLATGTDSGVSIYETASLRETAHFSWLYPFHVMFSSDNRYLLVNGTDTGALNLSKKDLDTAEKPEIDIDLLIHDRVDSRQGDMSAYHAGPGVISICPKRNDNCKRIELMTIVQDMVFSSDGTLLLGGTLDDAVIAWNVATGTEAYRLKAGDNVNHVALSPDGRYLAALVGDRQPPAVYVWDLTDQHPVAVIPYKSDLNDLTFSPDGNYIVIASNESLQMWPWSVERLIADACTRLPRNLTKDEWDTYIPGEPYHKTCDNLP
jgi:WD40 repeat protein